MERLYDLKEFLLSKKYYLIGGIIFLLLLGFSIYFSFGKSTNTKEEIIFTETKEELVEEQNECYVNVDIKGEVNIPGLYQLTCDSRVKDVIELAGGITEKGDTSILNLGKKLLDEMVIIVYSKDEIKNFNVTKQEENTKIENCINNKVIENNACIEIDNIINSFESSNSTNNELFGDTPVKVLISLNKASKEELMTLTGIGESKANNIINYRNENGSFKRVEELKNVKGIGDSIFDKIKNDITL